MKKKNKRIIQNLEKKIQRIKKTAKKGDFMVLSLTDVGAITDELNNNYKIKERKKFKVWRPEKTEIIDIDGKKLPSYKVVLETAGVKHKAEGESIDEAIASLGLSWEQIKAKGVMKVSQGKKSVEYLFYLNQLKRIFANKMTRFIWAKRLGLLLKEGAIIKNKP